MNMNDYKRVTDRLTPDERCRKEVLDMSKRENKIKLNTNEYTESVSGVEVRSGHGIMKYVGIAAACAIIVGGIGTTGVLLHKGSKNAQQFAEVIEEETTAEAVTEITEEPTEPPVEYDYEAIANELTQHYIDSLNVMQYGDVSYDSNESITFYTYDSTREEWSNNYGGERTFYKVTDERFKSCQDIYEYYKAPIASSIDRKHYGETYESFTMPDNFKDAADVEYESSLQSWLGGDVSKFENGSRVDIRPNGKDTCDDEAFSINIGIYVEYNGNLYVSKRTVESETAPYYANGKHSFLTSLTTEPNVLETEDNSFKASCFVKTPYTGWENAKYGDEKIITFNLINGEWKISSIETGDRPEYTSAVAIQNYIEKRAEYNDINIGYDSEGKAGRGIGHIMDKLEVTEYDPSIHVCKVHAVLHNMNGEDALDMTAEISVNHNGSPVVMSADITRIKEYDSSYERPNAVSAN
ncbi:hypothetical protein [Ruminococcus flavefaciens]|uniref:Uncharacterized protein n=1 Tax=Ruminococcus flavefaciens TaxID=1265 RepID=A0A1K1M018_RUMFL|nr:hypothetical protein [Ruminococcus flavefaciens]SFW15262.1 hypothetical protein SAMN02910280_0821 [Ruminococcus flavefaciens]